MWVGVGLSLSCVLKRLVVEGEEGAPPLCRYDSVLVSWVVTCVLLCVLVCVCVCVSFYSYLKHNASFFLASHPSQTTTATARNNDDNDKKPITTPAHTHTPQNTTGTSFRS